MTDEMKRPARYWLTYLWTWPADVLSWLVLLLMWLLWGTKLHWNEGLWFEFKPNSWPTNTWYRIKIGGVHKHNPVELQPTLGRWRTWGGTTFVHGGFYGPGRSGGEGTDTNVEVHEHVHVEFAEAAMLLALLAALIVFILCAWFGRLDVGAWAGGIMWATGATTSYASRLIQAWVRGEDPYEGSVEEEAAYSIAEG
jgi:hypothetical protein